MCKFVRINACLFVNDMPMKNGSVLLILNADQIVSLEPHKYGEAQGEITMTSGDVYAISQASTEYLCSVLKED
jgi:hypothetical protein